MGAKRGGIFRGSLPHRCHREFLRARHRREQPQIPAGRAHPQALPRLQQRGEPWLILLGDPTTGTAGIRPRSVPRPPSSEGVDRIALKDVSTGNYVTAGTGANGGFLDESGTAADTSAQFDTFDWGGGILTLRAVANGKFVGRFTDSSGNWTPYFVNDQTQPNNGREDHDRTDMSLASGQEAVVKAVTAANPHTIVVVENSYPTTINWEQQNDPAILWTTHAGQETGHALADVLFGDYNPSGRLTQTWPQSQSQVADILNYDIIKSGQTYMYSDQPTLYPFGHGLSYTTFRYGNLRLSAPSMGAGGKVTVSVDVTNTGSRAGRDVVQLYDHQERSRVKQPLKKLIGFANVDLAPGGTATVRFTVKASDLAFWDVTRGRWVVESSPFDLMVGDSSAGIQRSAVLDVNGETIPPRNLAVPTQAQNFDDYQGAQLVDQSPPRACRPGLLLRVTRGGA